ncbi:hypothetical protein MesoLj113a_19140 [Mesorhizobium sp. 113-1-2]|uniref:hypothetical protein n=1 Tax=Mesorhizobium sp. 113-1-2 TaxID=2744515 RepID=UPI001925D314|nr:hypothetical protein [Mesorhizobium sp. 113-1-2]BCG70756.1 hypothetical protein MesoLj113a_19140 [Mesorhizobium sp. 113-1-2]
MRKSATTLAKITLGVMLATGTATVSMARGNGSDGHAVDFSDFSGGGIGNRQHQRPHHKVVFSDGEYHFQPWWNYDTDAAYCSFDAVNQSYDGPSGMWHSCP